MAAQPATALVVFNLLKKGKAIFKAIWTRFPFWCKNNRAVVSAILGKARSFLQVAALTSLACAELH